MAELLLSTFPSYLESRLLCTSDTQIGEIVRTAWRPSQTHLIYLLHNARVLICLVCSFLRFRLLIYVNHSIAHKKLYESPCFLFLRDLQ